MSFPPIAQMKCPACQGIVSQGDIKCRWCLSPLRQAGIGAPTQTSNRPSVAWTKLDQSYGDHAAWKTPVATSATVLVQDGEAAALLVNGELQATLPGGLTQVSSLYQSNSPSRVEVVFSKVRIGKFRWGQGDLTTSDGMTIGANGTVSIQENDPARFIQQLPQAQHHLSINDLKNIVLREIRSALKSLISKGSISDLQKDLRKYEEMISLEVRSRLNELGIGTSEFEILSFNLPRDYLGAVERKAVKSLETQAETSRLEQFKKIGVDVTKVATVEAAVGKTNSVQVVAGDYVAGPSIRDSVLVRSSVGGDEKVEDSVVTGGFTVSCPVCNTVLSPSKHKFCFECGTRVRVCAQCRIAMPSHGKFCSQCGNPLPTDARKE